MNLADFEDWNHTVLAQFAAECYAALKQAQQDHAAACIERREALQAWRREVLASERQA
jgi:hypothetical protein